MKTKKPLSGVFKVFQDKETFFEQIEQKKSNQLILKQVLTICLFGFAYGVFMEGYHSIVQALVSGVKIMVLFIASILICFPSLFIIQQVLGSKMDIRPFLGDKDEPFQLFRKYEGNFYTAIIYSLGQVTQQDYKEDQMNPGPKATGESKTADTSDISKYFEH